MDEDAIDLLCEKGYTKLYGVRPMKLVVDEEVTKPLSLLILKEDLHGNKKVYIKVRDGKIIVTQNPT